MKWFLVLAGLVFFSSFVASAPPTVSFSYTPTGPFVFQTVTFDPTITSSQDLNFLTWGFAGDGNITYNIASSNIPLFSDNFDDGDISNWDVNAGTWDASSFYLDGGALDGSGISKAISDMNTDGNSTITISYKIKPIGTSNGRFIFFTDQNGIVGTINGYEVLFRGGANSILRKIVNGTFTNLQNMSSGTVGVYSDINVSIKWDGNISVWIDGVFQGTVFDTTYTRGNRIILGTDNGVQNHNFDNILIKKAGTVFINKDRNETFSFNSSGVKNVCLTAGNNDGNSTSCQDVNVMGAIIFHVFDENTNLVIPSAVAEINGISFYSDSNGTINIGSSLPVGDYLIKISGNNYPARYFDFHLDIDQSISKDIYLLDSNKGRSIEFLIRDNNSTKYPNKFLRIIRNNKYVSQVPTGANAITTPIWISNIVKDYNFFIDNNTTSNNIFSYKNTTLTVNVPKNEKTLENITPFGLSLGDLTSIDINNLSTIQSFQIYPNTYHPYKLTVDANNLFYFDRFYNFRSRGGDTNISIQPYMLRASDGSSSALITITNSITQLKVPYYLVEFYTDVGNSSNILVESQQSDSAGQFLFSSITGKNYFLKIYDEKGDNFNTLSFISNANSVYFLNIISGLITTGFPSFGKVDVNILVPQNNFFYLNPSNNFGLQFILNSTGPQIQNTSVQIRNGSSVLYSNTFIPTFPETTFPSGTIFDANFSTSQDNIPINISISITTDSSVITKNYLFNLKQTHDPNISFPTYSGIIENVGVLGGVLIWFFILLLLSIGLRYNPVFGIDNSAMIFVAMIWTGIAGFMGILPVVIAFIAILGGIAYYGLSRRPIG